MMTTGPHHHPTGQHLTAFALGEASAGLALLIEAHLHFCAACRARAQPHAVIGGALLEAAPPASLAPGALARALAALPPATDEASRGDEIALLPAPVRAVARDAMGAKGFTFAAIGLKALDLTGTVGAIGEERVQLLRIEPGHGAPRHSHRGAELTLVLQGAFRDDTGLYRPGDVEMGTGGRPHRPVAEPGPICFALAVTDGNLRFTGALGFIQRTFGGES